MLFIPSFLSKTRRTFPCTGILPVLSPQNKSFIRSDTRSGTLYVTDVFAKPLGFQKLALKIVHGRTIFKPSSFSKRFKYSILAKIVFV